MQQMSSIFLSDVGELGSDLGAMDLLAEGAFCTETGRETPRLMGGLWAVPTRIRTI